MRSLAGWAGLLAMIPLTVAIHVAAQTETPAKKTAPKKKAASQTPAKKGAPPQQSGARTASAKKGKKGAKKSATTWRNRQVAPSAERYREIQSALAAKGYLQREDATGSWNEASAAALKRFQSDQNIEGAGKVNSLSLIALGLGPRYEAKAVPPAPAPPPR